MKILAILALFAAALSAQTTTLSGTAFKDLSGNTLTGSVCFGASYGNPTTCQHIPAGVLNSFSIANGTYTVWINENGVFAWQETGAVLSGGALAADTLFNGQFSFVINSVNLYLTMPLGQVNVLTCNGNAVVAPNLPSVGAHVWVVNLSTTTACSGTVNFGGNVLLQGAASTTFSIPAKNTADMVYTSAGGWVIGHIGT